MSLTLVLVNRQDMLSKILAPMIYLSRRGMVHCKSNDMSIQVRDVERRTMAVLTFEFDYYNCNLENRPECIVCINLIALSVIVAADREEAVTVYSSDQNGNIRFEFRDIGGVVTRSEVTQTLHPLEDWFIIDMPIDHLYNVGVTIPSKEIRRALERLDLPNYVGLPSNLAVIVLVNRQEVRFTARGQSVEVHGWSVFGLQQDEQLVIRMTFKHIKSYIAASKFSDIVWLLKSPNAHTPDILICPIIVEGVMKAAITYFYFSPPNQFI